MDGSRRLDPPCRIWQRSKFQVGRCVSPPSRSRTGPASPRRSVCAPDEMSSHCIADRAKDQTMNPLLSAMTRYVRRSQLNRTPRRTDKRKARQQRLFLEPLEDRLAPAVYTVNALTDTGAGTGLTGDLRYCINQTNSDSGPDTIQFNIGGGGVQSIALTSALPTITNAVTIDGWSQPGFAGTPLIELNGAGAGSAPCLFIQAPDTTVRGLVINRFAGGGIGIAAANTWIAGNYIGTDPTGTINEGNGGGIGVNDGCSHIIIGTNGDGVNDLLERNVIS